MIVSKTQKHPKVKTSPASKSAAPEIFATRDMIPDMIRDRAFQIYESRGSEPGNDKQDWLRAEMQIAEREIVSR
jgi:hypothetical protein